MEDIRWKQRMQNFEKALRLLNEACALSNASMLEMEGTIQRFEFTFELAWKTMKDFLNEKGVTVSYPREVIKTSFQESLIFDGDIWMQMLDSRNELTHVYDENKFKDHYQKIKMVFLIQLNSFNEKLNSLI